MAGPAAPVVTNARVAGTWHDMPVGRTGQRVPGKPTSTLDVPGSGERDATTFARGQNWIPSGPYMWRSPKSDAFQADPVVDPFEGCRGTRARLGVLRHLDNLGPAERLVVLAPTLGRA